METVLRLAANSSERSSHMNQIGNPLVIASFFFDVSTRKTSSLSDYGLHSRLFAILGKCLVKDEPIPSSNSTTKHENSTRIDTTWKRNCEQNFGGFLTSVPFSEQKVQTWLLRKSWEVFRRTWSKGSACINSSNSDSNVLKRKSVALTIWCSFKIFVHKKRFIDFHSLPECILKAQSYKSRKLY